MWETAFRTIWNARALDFRDTYRNAMHEFNTAIREGSGPGVQDALKASLQRLSGGRHVTEPEARGWIDSMGRHGGKAFSEAVFWALAYQGADLLESWTTDDLEPNLGLLYGLLYEWEDSIGPFDALHDTFSRRAESNRRAEQVAALQAMPRSIRAFSNGATYRMYAGGRSIAFENSKAHPSIQVADVLSYASRRLFERRYGYDKDPSNDRDLAVIRRAIRTWESACSIRPPLAA